MSLKKFYQEYRLSALSEATRSRNHSESTETTFQEILTCGLANVKYKKIKYLPLSIERERT